jgi:hypothetical protein
MSGLEVVGAISACITLVDLSKKLLDAAGDAHGLPEAFRVVQNLLPLIARTLQNAKDRSKTASKDDLVAVESALGSCRRDAQDLKDILEKVVTSEKDGHFTRYKKHMRSVGKGHKVETLARQIFEQLQLLQANHVFANVATRGDLKAAVIKLEEITSSEQSISRQILDSLLFEEIEWREEQIHESYGATFNWIFEDSSTPFKQWLDTGSEAFWICGKAGSGKSTLMKFLANHPVTDGNLRQWAGTHKLITIKHFFWNLGTKMQQTQLRLMQSLLHQILRHCPSFIPYASPSRWNAPSSDARRNAWTRKELTSAFDNIIIDRDLDTHFCFFIDGLDEYTDETGGDHYQLVQDLHSLNKSARVKLCVSSRPWTVFEDQYGKNDKLKIVMQDHTAEDMYNYVQGMFAEDARFLRLADVEPKAHDIIHEIVGRADGVFLWVFLIVKSLLRGLTDHDDTSELQRRLKEMPADLDTYFRRTFDSIEPVYRGEAMRAFQFLAEAGRLPLMFIYCISKEVADSRYGIGAKLHTMTKAELDKAHDKARSCVNKWCRDLVDVHQVPLQVPPQEWYAQEQVWISHRTVRDFLLTQEMQKEFLKYPICQTSHLEGICMAHLALTKIWPPAQIYMGADVTRWATVCEKKESMTPFEILGDLDLTTRTVTKTKNNSAASLVPESRAFWRLVVYHGLTLYVGQRLERDPSCKIDILTAILPDAEDGFFWEERLDPTILKIANALMAKGADPNEVTNDARLDDSVYNKTVWQKFLRVIKSSAFPGLAKLLLLNGADPDVKIMDSDGCLYDVRQCLLAGDTIWCTGSDVKNEGEVDEWLAEARARKAAKTLKVLEDVKDQNGSIAASLGPWYPTSIIIFVCAAVLAIYRDSIICFALPFLHDFGFRWRPDEA